MGRGPATFKQRDISAAIRAVVAAGCEVVRVEVDKSAKIAVITKTDERPPANDCDGPDEEIVL